MVKIPNSLKMFTQVLVQVVKILLGKMCIKPIHIKPISRKK